MVERRLEFERLDSRDLCATVGIGTEEPQVAEDRLHVPITIDDSTGVRAAEIRLRYDSTAWSIEPADIKTGSAWVRGGATMANVDAEAGEITVFVFAAEPLAGEQGNLLNIELSPQQPTSNTSAAIELDSVRLNEGAIETEVTGAVDQDYINPRVRAKHGLLLPERSLAFQSAAVGRASEPTVLNPAPIVETLETTTLRQTRDGNQPMGPHPLARNWQSTSAADHTPVTTRVVPSSPQRNFEPWWLMLTAEEARLRKRAA
jgi:hypothetical protein